MPSYDFSSTSLDIDVRNSWGSGMVVDFGLSAVTALNGWTIEFEYDGEIVNIWNARIVSRDGNRYVIENMGYNGSVAAGQTTGFGFQGSGSATQITPISINGEPYGETDPEPDPLPTVSVSDAVASEEDGTISFDVSLSEASDQDVTVTYETVAGSAQAGSDFEPQQSQIVIPAGQTSVSVSVPLVNDTVQEGTEHFDLRLVSADGAEIADGTGQGQIADSDPGDPQPAPTPPVVSVADASATEGNPGDSGGGSSDPAPATGSLITDGPLSTSGNQIVDVNGNAVQIRAVNWFGAENDVRAPHGLWTRPMTDMMDQMVAEGFNAIRLPFSVQNILEDQVATSVAGDPSLAGLTTLEIFDRIVDYAEQIGIKIILDAHRVTQGNGAEGIWYSGQYDETDWIYAWEILATRYGDSTAVIGADLLNEPHLGTWGTGQRNDWPAAAEIAGNAVLDIAPDWLILVEGIGSYDGDPYWWGGQLQGVRDRPVVLNADDKLVYSPHDYPASIYNQPWFNDGSNLYDVFRENWGFIYEEGIAPILLGEFGSRLENPLDLVWAEAITNYLAGDFDGDGVSDLDDGEMGPSFAWWSWNPNSGDTGGYLNDDWLTVRQNAAELLDPLLDGDATGGVPGDGSGPILMTFDVSLDAPAGAPVDYIFETRDGTALAGEDYVATSGNLAFAIGQQTATVQVELLPDTDVEGDETFSLVLIDGDGNETSAIGTIVDDDTTDPDDPGDTGDGSDPIVVTVTGGSVTEADPGMDHMHDDGSTHVHDDGHRYITFQVSLDAPATEELTLTYSTADGTAVADTTSDVAWDYHTATGSLVFAVGEQTKTVTVAVHPDTLVEETETFTFAVSGDNITGTLEATGTIYDNDTDDTGGGDTGGSGPFVGGGQTYFVGQTSVVTGFDPTRDVLDLGPNSIHNQIPIDTPDGFMMLNMFNSSLSLLLEGVSLADLHPENFAPISDAHLQQDLSAVLAYENSTGLVRPNTVYIRSHEQGLEEIVDFNPATDKISFFYLSVRGDGQRNFAVEDTPEGARFYNPLSGQSLTLRDVSFSELDSSHFEWRANQLEDGIAGRMGLDAVIDGFTYVSENIFSGKSVAMAGGVDRAPYHSQQGYEEYTGTPIGGGSDNGDGGSDGGTGDGSGPIVVTVTGGSVTEADPGMDHMHDDGSSHVHDDGHRYITFQVSLNAPATEELTLTYSTADGTAVADTTSDVAWDYHTATGSLVFAVGEQTKTVAVAVHPDTLVEDTETFTFAVSGDNITGTLEATGTIYDNDTDDGGGGDTGGSGPFVGGGQTYTVGQTSVVTGFDPTRDVLDLGPNSIHNQIPIDTPDGFMMLHMFNSSQSLLLEGVSLADLHPENFAPISDAHLQQDLSAVLAYENGSGLVRPNTVYIRSHEQGLEEIVDFNPATDKISFFYLSVRGDGQRNFAVEDTPEGARFYNPLSGQSLTLRDVSFSELDSSHFEWRANQLEDGIAGRMGLDAVIDGFTYVSENIFSGKSVAMAGGVDRAPYHSQQGYEEYTGTPIGGDSDNGDGGSGDGDTGNDPDPIVVTVTGGSVTEADPGMDHMHDDGSSHVHDDGHRYITFQISLDAPAAEELTLTYSTADGTAVADTTSDVAWDYHTATGSLVFAVGEQTKTVAVAVHPDTLVEDTETFTFAVSGDNITGTLEATGTIYDNDTDDGGGGDTGGSGPFVGGGQTYTVGQTSVVTGFDPTRDVLDLGPNSIHNQIPIDTPDGFMMLHMFNSSQSLLLEGVSLADLHPENFAPIADAHLQQDLSAVLAYENGTGMVRPNTVYIRSHEQGLEEIVDFDPATDKISFFYLSVRGDGQRNFAVEDTAEGARFYNPLSGQSLTLRDVSFSQLDSSHFEWRANQLEDGIAGRMGLDAVIDGFTYVSENIFSGKSVAMAGGVDRAPYHSQQGYEEYTGTPIGGGSDHGGSDDGDTGTGGGDDDGGNDDTGDAGSGDGNGVGTGSQELVLDDWGAGFVARFMLTPETDVNGGWTANIATTADIVNIWNAVIVSHENGVLVLSNAPYNGNVPAGQTIEVGFQGAGSSAGLELIETTMFGGLPASQTASSPQIAAVVVEETPVVVEGDGSDTLDARLVVAKDWGSGATVRLEITNTDQTDHTGGWEVSFDFDADAISRSWNSSWIETAYSDGITVSDVGWNGTVRAGETVKVGFVLNEGNLDEEQLNLDADFYFL